jgi:hypothetical protein
MAHDILKPLSEEEMKVRVAEFINAFIDLNRRNMESLDELKENYHATDLLLYRILKGSNGIVDSNRLLDIIQTLIVNYMLENSLLDSDMRTVSEPDRRFLYFLGILLGKYTQAQDGPEEEGWINQIIDTALMTRW